MMSDREIYDDLNVKKLSQSVLLTLYCNDDTN